MPVPEPTATRRWLVAVLVILTVAGATLGGLPQVAQAQTMLTPEQTLVRVVHASPDAPLLDVYLDELPIYGQAAFGLSSPYLPLGAGDHTVRVVPAGGAPERQALVETSVTLDPGGFGLLVVEGYLAELTVAWQPVETERMASAGYSRLRVTHAVPDARALTLTGADGTEVAADLVPLSASPWVELQGGQRDVAIRSSEGIDPVDIPATLALLPDVAYDLLVIGQVHDASVRVIAIPTPVDQPCARFLAIGGDTDGCARVVHATPDLAPVDVYSDDGATLLASGLAFGGVAGPFTVPEDGLDLVIVPSGTAPGDDIATVSLNADEGAETISVLAGPASHPKLETFEVDRAPVAGRQARVRVIHEADDTGTLSVDLGVNPLVRALLETETSESRLVAPGRTDISVTTTDDGAPVASLAAVDLQPGVSYDLLVVGDRDFGIVTVVVSGTAIPDDGSIPPALPTSGMSTPAPSPTIPSGDPGSAPVPEDGTPTPSPIATGTGA